MAELVSLTVQLLEVPEDLVKVALELESSERTVVADRVAGTDCIFLAGLYRAERVIAQHLQRIASGPLPWPSIDRKRALAWIEQKTGMTLMKRIVDWIGQDPRKSSTSSLSRSGLRTGTSGGESQSGSPGV